MKVTIPQEILDIATNLANQDGRYTSHPFYQVREQKEFVTEEGYDSEYFNIYDESGLVWNEKDAPEKLAEYLIENYEDWVSEWLEMDNPTVDDFIGSYDFDCCDDLPDGMKKLYMQLIEIVVSTHLTLADAEAFIERKRHDYGKLYTYVESAYWSQDIRAVQDFLKGLTSEVTNND